MIDEQLIRSNPKRSMNANKTYLTKTFFWLPRSIKIEKRYNFAISLNGKMWWKKLSCFSHKQERVLHSNWLPNMIATIIIILKGCFCMISKKELRFNQVEYLSCFFLRSFSLLKRGLVYSWSSGMPWRHEGRSWLWPFQKSFYRLSSSWLIALYSATF